MAAWIGATIKKSLPARLINTETRNQHRIIASGAGNRETLSKNPKIHTTQGGQQCLSSVCLVPAAPQVHSLRGATMKMTVFALLIAVAVSACAPAATPIAPAPTAVATLEASTAWLFPTVTPISYKGLVSLFDYDRTEPLGYRETGQIIRGDITVRDISCSQLQWRPGQRLSGDAAGRRPLRRDHLPASWREQSPSVSGRGRPVRGPGRGESSAR